MTAPPWHIVTPEYPPARGGVSDYTRSLARGLAAAGDIVHVWAPSAGALAADAGVTGHGLPSGFGPRGLWELARSLGREPSPKRVLLQYVPQGFGFRGMNVPFCAWMASLPRDRGRTQLWVMFHEVAVLWEPRWRPRRAVLAGATHAMAALLLARADRDFVSSLRWEDRLRPLARSPLRVTWLPIPSNLPVTVPAGTAEAVRRRLGLEGRTVIGHFGTYGPLIAPNVRKAAHELLRVDPRRVLLVVGLESERFAREMAGGAEGAVADRVIPTGRLEPEDAAAHLAACDVLVQPFADGVSARRTSLMAGLSLGVPIATNRGYLSEPIWADSGAVELASAPDRVSEKAEALLRDPGRARLLGERGRQLYRSAFSLERTLRTLRGEGA